MTTACKQYFAYGEKETEYLKKKDKKLAKLIDLAGHLDREINHDIFAALVESIVGQQISDKAALSVYKRLTEMTEITAEKLDAVNAENIQKCGMSMKKAGYIKNIARAVVSKELDTAQLAVMSDQQIIEKLTQIKGVGVWTAEMMLIFSLSRPDVVSYTDLVIRRSIMKLYGLKSLTKQQFARYAKRYSPYGSIASFYLWSLDEILTEEGQA